MELLVDHIGPRHRIALDRPGTALAGEVDGGFHQRTTDSAPPEPGSSEHARERPDGVVGLVLAAAPTMERGCCAAGPSRRSAARRRTSRPVRRRGRPRGHWWCPSRRAHSPSAAAAERRAPRPETRRRTPSAPTCTAGTDTGTPSLSTRTPSASRGNWLRLPVRPTPEHQRWSRREHATSTLAAAIASPSNPRHSLPPAACRGCTPPGRSANAHTDQYRLRFVGWCR